MDADTPVVTETALMALSKSGVLEPALMFMAVLLIIMTPPSANPVPIGFTPVT